MRVELNHIHHETGDDKVTEKYYYDIICDGNNTGVKASIQLKFERMRAAIYIPVEHAFYPLAVHVFPNPEGSLAHGKKQLIKQFDSLIKKLNEDILILNDIIAPFVYEDGSDSDKEHKYDENSLMSVDDLLDML